MRTVMIALLSLAATMLLCGCCDDCPTKPDNPPEVEEHYRVYVSAIDINTHAHSINVIDMPADTLIDSVTLTHGAEWFRMSPDNSRILVRDISNRSTVAYNANDLSYDTTFDVPGGFLLDPSHNIGLLDSSDWLLKFDANTFQIEARLQLPLPYRFGYIHEESGILYVSTLTPAIYLIDYLSMTLIDSIIVQDTSASTINVWRLVPVPEYDRIYFYSTENGATYAYVYDTDSDKVVSRLPHTTAFGSFARTLDGSTVYKCDPGRTFMDEHGSYLIWVYDVPTDQVAGLYTTWIGDTLGYRKIDVAELILTPNERYLLATATMELALLRYDLSTGLATSAFSFMYPKMPLHVEVGERIM